jgi:hypothetical protein
VNDLLYIAFVVAFVVGMWRAERLIQRIHLRALTRRAIRSMTNQFKED